MIAGFLLNRRNCLGILICALLAGPFCAGAKAQAVQPQTGSSTGQTQPAQAQGQQQSQPSADQSKNKQDETKKKQGDKTHAQAKQKKVKAHVVNLDKKKKAEDDTTQSAEPDKILYQRAILDVKKGRFTEGRLTLQSLINTYPDSEYLAKAKLAVADSYYKEGGTSNLTQAIDEYKNFIIFFPFLDEAAYAQMQMGMGHLRMMEKADRDTTQALEAEQEFQTFLMKYPQSPLIPKAEQDLRDVQEVLADGQYRIARFYFVKQDYPASAARLMELTERYPLYSQSDEALWMLGDVYARAKRISRNEDDKNHWADLAGKCYSRIVQNYPLSHLTPEAKARLTAMGMAVPQADPQALARMKQEQMYQKEHHQIAVLRFPMAMLKSGPPLDAAARAGTPNLNPPNDAVSAREVLLQGAKGPDFELANKPPADTTNQNANEETTPVEAAPGAGGMNPQGTGVGVQIISPTDSGNSPASATQPSPGSGTGSGTAPNPAPSTEPKTDPPASSNVSSAPAAASSPGPVQGGTATPAAAQDPPAANASPNGQTAGSASGNANAQGVQADDKKPAKADKADPSSESTSKKKKGIKKVIPW